VPLSYKVTEVH